MKFHDQSTLSQGCSAPEQVKGTHPHLPDTCPCLLYCLCNTVSGTRKLTQLKIKAFECVHTSSGLKLSLSCCSLHLFTSEERIKESQTVYIAEKKWLLSDATEAGTSACK